MSRNTATLAHSGREELISMIYLSVTYYKTSFIAWLNDYYCGPCRLFFVSKVEIHSERSPISDRRARRKFAMGPTHYPSKRIP
jgi:hypothetical protein